MVQPSDESISGVRETAIVIRRGDTATRRPRSRDSRQASVRPVVVSRRPRAKPRRARLICSQPKRLQDQPGQLLNDFRYARRHHAGQRQKAANAVAAGSFACMCVCRACSSKIQMQENGNGRAGQWFGSNGVGHRLGVGGGAAPEKPSFRWQRQSHTSHGSRDRRPTDDPNGSWAHGPRGTTSFGSWWAPRRQRPCCLFL